MGNIKTRNKIGRIVTRNFDHPCRNSTIPIIVIIKAKCARVWNDDNWDILKVIVPSNRRGSPNQERSLTVSLISPRFRHSIKSDIGITKKPWELSGLLYQICVSSNNTGPNIKKDNTIITTNFAEMPDEIHMSPKLKPFTFIFQKCS